MVDKGVRPASYRSERIDTVSGAIWSDLVSIFIIIATAAAVGGSGPLQSAREAAQALEPAVGRFAPQLFAAGLLGASLLAASVVPLSTSYAVAEATGTTRSVSASFREAPLFYGLFTLQIVVGAGIALAPGNLVSLVVNAQVLNGIITPLLLTYVLILANRKSVLGAAVNGRIFRIVATVCVSVVGILSFVVLLQTVTGLGWQLARSPRRRKERQPGPDREVWLGSAGMASRSAKSRQSNRTMKRRTLVGVGTTTSGTHHVVHMRVTSRLVTKTAATLQSNATTAFR